MKAEPLYRRSLAIREKVYGSDHPDTEISLTNLAYLLEDQGNYKEAEPSLYRRSLAICEKVLGPDHPDTQQYHLNNLAYLLHEDQGNYKEAEPLYRKKFDLL